VIKDEKIVLEFWRGNRGWSSFDVTSWNEIDIFNQCALAQDTYNEGNQKERM